MVRTFYDCDQNYAFSHFTIDKDSLRDEVFLIEKIHKRNLKNRQNDIYWKIIDVLAINNLKNNIELWECTSIKYCKYYTNTNYCSEIMP